MVVVAGEVLVDREANVVIADREAPHDAEFSEHGEIPIGGALG